MLVFAKFVMRDSGLPIHINTPHVTQVRLTIDGEPAIYLVGKDTPILVEGTLDGAMKILEAAAAGLRLVEPEPPALVPVEAVVATAPMLEAPTMASSPEPKAKSRSPKKVARKPASMDAQPPTKSSKINAPAALEPAERETVSSAMSWFKGAR